jgi:hypothetical protein
LEESIEGLIERIKEECPASLAGEILGYQAKIHNLQKRIEILEKPLDSPKRYFQFDSEGLIRECPLEEYEKILDRQD